MYVCVWLTREKEEEGEKGGDRVITPVEVLFLPEPHNGSHGTATISEAYLLYPGLFVSISMMGSELDKE